MDFGADRTLTELKLYFLDTENGPAVEATGEEEGSGFPLLRDLPWNARSSPHQL